ncbi:MAG: hypothetical protein IJW55_04430 [Clostridia bacterium]|nr:hypothetical protein [Clostridia bacterium]
MNEQTTKAWQLYEAGKDYKRRIGLYETVRRNERFYRGDQWHGSESDLPRPVFNLVRRITDYLVSSVLPGDISIRYTDDKLPYLESEAVRAQVIKGLEILDRNAAYRWKRGNLRALAHRALLNAATAGDGVFYCWWDAKANDGQPFLGEVRTDLIDNTDLFVADVNSTDLQGQEYILLAGRATVSSLRREAVENGMSEREAAAIVGDSETETRAGDLAAYELQGNEKATYLIRFFREGGEVVFEKSTRHHLLRRVRTGLRYYPVAYFNWYPAKGCFHGNAPISDMIANQKYINTAYAMVMKHMYDTAFSKVVYDKSRIPEWSNEVGEAIAAVGGGNVADAVSVVGVGKMQEGYLELLTNVIETTKSMMGATESALGDEDANNTSAILVLQQASQLALRQVSAAFCRCIGELASIWADMLCVYCPAGRRLPVAEGEHIAAMCPDYRLLRDELLRATAEVSHIDAYTPAATVTLLDKLLDGGHLTPAQYVELLPEGTLDDRAALLEKMQKKGDVRNE